MEKIRCTKELENQIRENKIIMTDNEVIKRCTDYEAIDIIDANRSKLTSDYYAFPEKIILSEFDEYLAIVMKNFEPIYKTLDYQTAQIPIAKKEIFLTIFKILEELNNINVDYFDIHGENFLISQDNKVKVVDLESSYVGVSWHSRQMQELNLLQLIFEVYLFKDFKRIDAYLEFTRNAIDVYHYFSCQSANRICRKEIETITFEELSILLDELEDKDRIQEIKKAVKARTL